MAKRIHLKPAEAKNMGLLTKSELKMAGLMPGPTTRPAGSVWQGRSAYSVYRPDDCITWRRGLSPAQLRRQSVSAVVKDLLGNDCVVIDVETTGLCQTAQICEIAMIDTGGSTLLNTFVRPTCSIPAEATAIHGITDAMVSDAPGWPDVASQYEELSAGKKVVAYNAAFDSRMLQQTYAQHGLIAPCVATACAMQLYARWRGVKAAPGWRWFSLSEAASDCGSVVVGEHRALVDALMALDVLKYMPNRH